MSKIKTNFICKAGLKARGWTDTLINHFMPKCDRLARNPYYACAPEVKLYKITRVERIEKKDTFKAAFSALERKRKKALDTFHKKEEKMKAYAKSLNLGIPTITKEELTVIAISDYNKRKENLLTLNGKRKLPEWYHAITIDSDEVIINSILYIYIKERIIDYGQDKTLRAFGKKLYLEGIELIKKRLDEEIISFIKPSNNTGCRYLFLDTETTGLDYVYDHLLQIAWIMTDQNNKEISSGNFIIDPQGIYIPKESIAIHGITKERAIQEGCPLKEVLRILAVDWRATTFIVGHSVEFDIDFIQFKSIRCNVNFQDKKIKDTAQKGKLFCKIPSSHPNYMYHTPSLVDLFRYLFGYDFKGAHNAMADAEASRRCYWGMLKGIKHSNVANQ